ncbi:MAG TPA: MBOAT family protein [Phycisphaerae bacterium]|nr:MBOAT family protein [Phycisphaerae bacterium]
MIFSSWLFAFYFVAVFGVYWGLRTRRSRHVFLLLASCVFYMTWNPWLILLIFGTIAIDYAAALMIDRSDRTSRRKAVLLVSLVSNLGVLAVFKYADFFILSFRDLLQTFGFHSDLQTLSILLPVGISFFTFQSLSYTVDVYRRVIPPVRSFVDFSLFVMFFPQLVAGPIVKARDFLPQLETIKRFDWRRIDAGIVLFMIGLTKKLLIADQLATLVDPVFADPTRYSTRDLWLAMFCYGGQIYCDFSGYTDMAIACARMMGFELFENFANPYLATSLVDFWRRWHISLSTWLRDYLYIPLGGSRFGKWLTYRNLMITMLLGGLWHGASWTFVIWGAIHGLALSINKAFGRRSDANLSGAGPTRYLRTASCWALTLLVVHIAWVFFRCQPVTPVGAPEPEPTVVALQRAAYFVTHLFVAAEPDRPVWIMNKIPMVLALALMFGMQLYDEWTRHGRPGLRLPAPLAGIGYAAWLFALLILSPANTSPFIYFQF